LEDYYLFLNFIKKEEGISSGISKNNKDVIGRKMIL
jgi:hypothetical protein